MQTETKHSIINFLNTRWYYHGRGANLGWWASFKKTAENNLENPGNAEQADLTKPISGKTFGHISILVLEYHEYHGLNIKIDIFLPSYLEWATVFEGWLSMKVHLFQLFNFLGIDNKPYKVEDEKEKD